MRVRSLVALVGILAVGAVVAANAQSGSAAGRPNTGRPAKWTTPRTPDGKPDLQGNFTFATITPLQRPAALNGKDVLSPEEAAAFEKSENDRLNRDLFD